MSNSQKTFFSYKLHQSTTSDGRAGVPPAVCVSTSTAAAAPKPCVMRDGTFRSRVEGPLLPLFSPFSQRVFCGCVGVGAWGWAFFLWLFAVRAHYHLDTPIERKVMMSLCSWPLLCYTFWGSRGRWVFLVPIKVEGCQKVFLHTISKIETNFAFCYIFTPAMGVFIGHMSERDGCTDAACADQTLPIAGDLCNSRSLRWIVTLEDRWEIIPLLLPLPLHRHHSSPYFCHPPSSLAFCARM